VELDQKQKEIWISAQVGWLPSHYTAITVTHPADYRHNMGQLHMNIQWPLCL